VTKTAISRLHPDCCALIFGRMTSRCQASEFQKRQSKRRITPRRASRCLLCYLSLGWALPRNCIDFYAEFKNDVSGLKPPPQFRQPKFPEKWKSSLLDVMQWCGFPVRSVAEKKAVRDRIRRGHPFSAQESGLILKYCRDDVIDTALVAKKMLPHMRRSSFVSARLVPGVGVELTLH
jgi:hypothetical protein